jgi:hypothetical protein
VRREVDFVDVYAERGKDKLYAEAKGRTTAIGLDVHTLYGQLLRRMKDPGTSARYTRFALGAAFAENLRASHVRIRRTRDVLIAAVARPTSYWMVTMVEQPRNPIAVVPRRRTLELS